MAKFAGLRSLAPTLLLAGLVLLATAAGDARESWFWRPLHPVVALWMASVLLGLPRDRLGLLVLAVSCVARWITWSPRILYHFVKAYGSLGQAQGTNAPDVHYGDAFSAFHGLVTRLWGWDAHLAHGAHAVVSALLPPSLYAVMKRGGASSSAAGFAGLAAALLPLSLAMAPGPEHCVLVATLAVTAVAGAVDARPVGAALAVSSAGLLAHLRPEQLPVALVVLVPLALSRRWGALALGLGLVGWRVAELAAYLAATGNTSGAFGVWSNLPGPGGWVGDRAAILVLDPVRVPLAIPALALVGLVAPGGPGGLRRGVACLALGTTVMQLDLMLLVDRLRFQSPSLAWWCALAGLGWAALPARWLRLVALLGGAASWRYAAAPMSPPFPWQVEYTVLQRVAPTLTEGQVVRYAAAHDPDGSFAYWAGLLSGASWQPALAQAEPGELRWVGPGDLHPGAPPLPWERMEPIDVVVTAGNWGDMADFRLLEPYPDKPVRIGLYRVRAAP